MTCTVTRPLTILQIIPRINAGGAELGCIQIADAQVAAGHRALVASEGGRLEPRLTAAGATHIAMPLAAKTPWGIVANAGRLAEIIRREKVDIIHARSRAPAWSGLIAARRTGIAFVTTYHSAYNEPNAAKRQYNKVMAAGHAVIAVSDHMAELIRERYQTPEHRIAVIHRCIDPAQFDAAAVTPERVAAVLRQVGATAADQIVLMPARISQRKVQDHVVEAIGILAQRGRTEFICVFAGEVEKAGFHSGLVARAKVLGIAERLRFPGHVNDIAALNHVARVSLNVSAFEGLPRVVLEAQAMGLPVIVSDTGPGREAALTPPAVPLAAASGLRVGFGQHGELAAAIAAILDLPEPAWRAMGQRGMAFVRDRFTLDRMQRLTLAVYDRVAALPQPLWPVR